jgi:hypothetical protein
MVKADAALKNWELLHDESAIARTHLLLGNLAYYRSGAVSRYRLAGQGCGTINDLRCTAEVDNNLGLALLKSGEVDSARLRFTAALNAWRALRMKFGELSTVINLGLLYWQTTDWDLAIRSQPCNPGHRPIRSPSEQPGACVSLDGRLQEGGNVLLVGSSRHKPFSSWVARSRTDADEFGKS